MIRYTVTAKPKDQATLDAFVRWMIDEHAAEVLAAPGCKRFELVSATPETLRCEYVFESRAALARYYEERAPGLRAKGLARFPGGAVTFERDEAEIMVTWTKETQS